MSKFKPGFTLIELLVVISIISLLSSIVFASVNVARTKARDARRVADLRQIATALQFYFDDHGFLPTTASYGESNPQGGWDYSSLGGFLPFLAGTYMSRVPVDPINDGVGDVAFGGTGFSYAYYCYSITWPNPIQRNGVHLFALLERPQDFSGDSKLEGGIRYTMMHSVSGEHVYNCQ